MCGWQVKLFDPLLTRAIAYLSALEVSVILISKSLYESRVYLLLLYLVLTVRKNNTKTE